MKRLLYFLVLFFLIACRQGQENDRKQLSERINLEEISIAGIQKGYKEGIFTITDIVKAYLERIDSLDRHGPELNSIILVNPDALQIAAELDRELAEGRTRGPLHGIPVVLKDNIDTHDKMPNTAGATVLRNSFPAEDSYVAKKLREAGAVILAKSNLSEWANFRASFSSSGWSGIGGQTKNPYILDRNPCGSSSGSGVAVSANLCAFAIGTETDGSIVCPSNNNGIAGLKPTVGLISRSGIIPISFTQDTPGPMCRTVEDIAIALGSLTGVDSTDTKTLASAGHFETDYTKYLDENALKGKRIGLLKASMGFHYKVDSLMHQAVSFMKSQGAEVIELDFDLPASVTNASFQVLLFEFKDGLNRYFKGLGDQAPVKSLEELIRFNASDSVELKYFDQHLLELAQAKGGTDTRGYKEALALMLKGSREEGIDMLMDKYRLDALVLPTGSPAWKTDLVNGDHYIGGNSSLAAIAGYPGISVPMGFIGGLPVGVSFVGRAWSEPLLIGLAYAFEQGTKARKPPEYLYTD